MVHPENVLDFLKQTTQFLGYSTQVLPASIIGITITLLCLALPLPHMQSFSSFQLFPCYTTEIFSNISYHLLVLPVRIYLSFQVSKRTTTILFIICNLFKDDLSNAD